MPNYCCFTCPSKDYSEKELDSRCPVCGRRYGFPLEDLPEQINRYKVVGILGRGFYASAYVAQYGALNQKVVLKVTPASLYSFFGKDFKEECLTHLNIAEGTEHVVQIQDMFDTDVHFGSTTVQCHVAVLRHVAGTPLSKLVNSSETLHARTAAQVAIDLLRIKEELELKGVHHNDLHAENIIVEQLKSDSLRAEALDPTIRVVAIDLGSIADESKSRDASQRVGDIHWIARHIRSMVRPLLNRPTEQEDLDYRIAAVLEVIAQNLSPKAESQRTPTASDFSRMIKDAAIIVESPWRTPLRLASFRDSYNAQTLEPWFVPLLLIDHDDKWVREVSSPGPQVVTGMRGCGKTMLLRALEFHARATQRQDESPESALLRVSTDSFVGLFVSSTRLLENPGSETQSAADPLAKLYVAYLITGIRALRHLNELKSETISFAATHNMEEALTAYLSGLPESPPSTSLWMLERRLLQIQTRLNRGEVSIRLNGNAANAFPYLAYQLRSSAALWSNVKVLFLLDDVSTRHLPKDRISGLFSSLLFQDPSCAFKLSTETQTLELVLQSPGGVERANIGRDYQLFNLGAEVYKRISSRKEGNGKRFVGEILARRAKYFGSHPSRGDQRIAAAELLGDTSLAAIAEKIASTSKTSRDRKALYFGMTALARMCVGDIGDVISLYDSMLTKWKPGTSSISAEDQSDCFQAFSTQKLYHLNRRNGELKNVVKAFAEASHELLVKSQKDFKANRTSRSRLRQYLMIYVRVTSGDAAWQMDRLRDLIDAGVFVFAGGSEAPRSKTRDSNPSQQFKLTFRKVFGLANYIGLAESDRFELSGDALEQFLKAPSKAILMSNLGVPDSQSLEDEESNDESLGLQVSNEGSPSIPQPLLFSHEPMIDLTCQSLEPGRNDEELSQAWVLAKSPKCERHELKSLYGIEFDTVVCGLGFEERSLESLERISNLCRTHSVVMLNYPEEGHGNEMKAVAARFSQEVRILDYAGSLEKQFDSLGSRVLVDLTGLAKPALFSATRAQLLSNKEVWLCRTKAETYYPRDVDIQPLIEADNGGNHYDLLEKLSGVLTGEDGPYWVQNLTPAASDESRSRFLWASSSPKHERLMSLLYDREFNHIEIAVPRGSSPRARIARIVAEIAARDNHSVNLTTLDSDDLQSALEHATSCYRTWFVENGYNFELGLTGSKLQAVACAAMSACFKTSHSWYVRPKQFDTKKFSEGTGESQLFRLWLEPGSPIS